MERTPGSPPTIALGGRFLLPWFQIWQYSTTRRAAGHGKDYIKPTVQRETGVYDRVECSKAQPAAQGRRTAIAR